MAAFNASSVRDMLREVASSANILRHCSMPCAVGSLSESQDSSKSGKPPSSCIFKYPIGQANVGSLESRLRAEQHLSYAELIERGPTENVIFARFDHG
jgi:hypothetical protein